MPRAKKDATEDAVAVDADATEEFRKTGVIPSGYVFDGRSLSRAIADKPIAGKLQHRAQRPNDAVAEPENEQPPQE